MSSAPSAFSEEQTNWRCILLIKEALKLGADGFLDMLAHISIYTFLFSVAVSLVLSVCLSESVIASLFVCLSFF